MKDDLVTMCCRCKKIKIGNLWVGEEHPSYELLFKCPNIDDGYCPECINYYREEHRKLKHEYALLRN